MSLDIETSIAFVKDRAEKTLAAQNAILAKWIWPLKTVAQWQADLSELDIARDGTESDTTPSLANLAALAEQAATKARTTFKTRLDTIHGITVQALGIMRSRAQKDASVRPIVNKLSARGDSQAGIEDEGGSLLAAWKIGFGTTFEPLPGVTFDGLRELFEGKKDADGNVLIPSLRQLKSDTKDAEAIDSKASGTVAALISRLEDECVSWYAEATEVFAAGTPEGDMIRGTIPTSDQYGNAAATPAAPPSPTPSMPTPPSK